MDYIECFDSYAKFIFLKRPSTRSIPSSSRKGFNDNNLLLAGTDFALSRCPMSLANSCRCTNLQ